MKALIIGSGLSGLLSGALLAKKGVEVEIFEQADHLGGVTAPAEKNGFKWEQGPLLLGGFWEGEPIYEVLKSLDITLPFMRADRGIWMPDFDMWKPDEYAGPYWRRERLKELFPEEKKAIDAYFRFNDDIWELMYLNNAVAKKKTLGKQIRLAIIFSRIKKYINMSAQELMDSFFKDERIKALFMGILADFCVSPKDFHCFGVPMTNCESAFDIRVPLEKNGEHILTGYGYIKGGCGKLVDELVKYIESHGGKTHTNTTVEKIFVEDGKATGLRLCDGTEYKGDIVIASGGMQEVFYDLVGKEHLSEEYKASIDRCEVMDGVFMVHLGIDIDPLQYQKSALCYYYKTYDIDQALATMRTGKYHGGDDGFLIFVPSYATPSYAPEGMHAVTVYTVCPDELDGESWEQAKDRYTKKLIELAEEHIPGLSEHIVEMQVMTPVELREMTYKKKSAFGGVVPRMGAGGPAHVTCVKGLYFVGAQSESGGGVDAVMKGVMKAFDELCKIENI